MKIYLGADHRGYQLKEEIKHWLKTEGHEVIDCGNDHYDEEDDYVDFARKVALNLQTGGAPGGPPKNASRPDQGDAIFGGEARQDPSGKMIGILFCGSGIGASVGANRFRGVRCALGINKEQVKHGVENDHINCLSIPAEFVGQETTKEMVKTLLESTPKMEEKYLRRVKKLDE